MRWAVTGTPGTGKTSAVRRLRLDHPVVHLNELIESRGFSAGRDEDRESVIADIGALRAWLADQPEELLVESHLAHLLPVDRVVVLRCDPVELRRRLLDRAGGDISQQKVAENVESERLDLILAEAVEDHGAGHVYEIDTTGRSPDHVASAIADAVAGRRQPAAGTVSFLEDP